MCSVLLQGDTSLVSLSIILYTNKFTHFWKFKNFPAFSQSFIIKKCDAWWRKTGFIFRFSFNKSINSIIVISVSIFFSICRPALLVIKLVLYSWTRKEKICLKHNIFFKHGKFSDPLRFSFDRFYCIFYLFFTFLTFKLCH